MQWTPDALTLRGCNILVEVSTASAFVAQKMNPVSKKTIAVMAHLDTGASLTTLDKRLADWLQLTSTGDSPISTANGVVLTPNYAIDISFLNTRLRSIQNLQVSSCQIGNFNLENAIKKTDDPMNFGLLIGRDIMSFWNVVWNGPTSTILISD